MTVDHRPTNGDTGEERIKVLYVMCYGRSGSTIVGNILGAMDGVFHAGELRSIWGLGLMQGRMCGCGVPVRECPLWQGVLTEALGGPVSDDPAAVFDAQREAMRLRTTMRVLRTQPDEVADWPALRIYSEAADRLYRAISAYTGSRVVVDTSKRQAEAALLHLLPGIDPYVVQLVRDPRAVAFSWQRVKASPGEGSREMMPRHGAVVTGRNWLSLNLAAEALRRRAVMGRTILVRYEDFVSKPRSTMERLARFVGEPPEALPFLDEHTVQLGENHTAGGNPGRLASGPTRIRLDDEWLDRQSAGRRFVATSFALPLLHRYRYPLFPRAAS
jgi:hypothetical protein